MLGLHPFILISKGAKVMLTMNLWASVGLCNGSTGTIIDIIYAENHAPPDLPIAVLVKFDDYCGPSFATIPSIVPIPPVTATVNVQDSILERQQLPLTLAWALTIHKSQGMTLKKAWIDIGKRETTLGMTYVAISRARNLLSLIIEPMTFDRLTCITKNESLQYRLEEEKRLQAIAKLQTCNSFCVSYFSMFLYVSKLFQK
jgi:ATP-dependent exoDNAse (exonuclease V) alpha subunit